MTASEGAMLLSEWAARERDASVVDLKALIEGGHPSSGALSFDVALRIVRLTRLTEAFNISNLSLDYYMHYLPELLRSTGILKDPR